MKWQWKDTLLWETNCSIYLPRSLWITRSYFLISSPVYIGIRSWQPINLKIYIYWLWLGEALPGGANIRNVDIIMCGKALLLRVTTKFWALTHRVRFSYFVISSPARVWSKCSFKSGALRLFTSVPFCIKSPIFTVIYRGSTQWL